MAKETFYFQHDYNSRNDKAIQVLLMENGPSAYGIFWGLVEVLHEEECHGINTDNVFVKSFAKQMSTDVEHVLKIIKEATDLKLFYRHDNMLYSERVERNIDKRSEISELRSKAGKASAAKRASNKTIPTRVQQNPTKEIKEKKENETLLEKNSSELRSSEQMIESACMLNKISKDTCKALLEKFILEQKGCDGIYRDISEIKRHFGNWVPKEIKETKANTPVTNKQPIPKISRGE